MKKPNRGLRAVLGLLTLAATLSACSSSGGKSASSSGTGSSSSSGSTSQPGSNSSKSVMVSVGGGRSVKVTGPLSIAFISAGLGNAYGLAQSNAAKKEAKAVSASIKVFDGGFNGQTQFNLIQTVIASHKYNAIIVVPDDGNLLCHILTNNAPAAGILVATVADPLCNTSPSTKIDDYAPAGTFAMLRPEASFLTFNYYVQQAVKAFPGHQNVIAINGLPVADNTKVFTKALNAEASANKNFHLEANVNLSAYTYQDALSKVQAAFQAHPDVTLVMSSLGDAARAAVDTLRRSGKLGKVKIVDADAGSESSLKQIAAGNVTFALANFPGPDFTVAVQALNQALHGATVPRVIDSSEGTIKAGTNGQQALVSKANVNEFLKFQYPG